MKTAKAAPIRPTAQAGRFYPDDPDELRETVRSLLDGAGATPSDDADAPLGLLAPHAGYIFSGSTAASAYRRIEGRSFGRVVLLAPSHYARFPGASIYDGEAYATPLGPVPLDQEAIGALRAAGPLFGFCPDAHAQEHSIEVQLPFLQTALEDFRLVPILLSDQTEENVFRVADALDAALESLPAAATLFIASSDLYHGYDYEDALISDHRFVESLGYMEPRRLLRDSLAGLCMACGAGAIAVAMALALRRGATRAQPLRRTNSHDAASMPGSAYIVGYLAAAFERGAASP